VIFHFISFAKKALAFFNISFSIRNNLFSLRKRFSSSRSGFSKKSSVLPGWPNWPPGVLPYPKEFKEEAVSLINNQGYSVPEAAKSFRLGCPKQAFAKIATPRSFAKKALAFFNISFSIRNNLFSLRKRFSSSRSSSANDFPSCPSCRRAWSIGISIIWSGFSKKSSVLPGWPNWPPGVLPYPKELYLSLYVITCFLYVSASALRAHLQLMIFPVADLQFPQRLILIVAEEPLDHVTLKSVNPYF
jgi:hypothetical protein